MDVLFCSHSPADVEGLRLLAVTCRLPCLPCLAGIPPKVLACAHVPCVQAGEKESKLWGNPLKKLTCLLLKHGECWRKRWHLCSSSHMLSLLAMGHVFAATYAQHNLKASQGLPAANPLQTSASMAWWAATGTRKMAATPPPTRRR